MGMKRVGRMVSQQLFLTLMLGVSVAQAGVGVDVNVHLGDQPRPVIVREPVAPPPPPQVVVVEDDVDFVYPEDLGFYVAVGVPYDLFYLGNRYYVFREGRWLCAPSSHGPWAVTHYRELPPRLRRHRIERIREYRTREYEVYRRDHDHYRGRYFRSPKAEWKAERRAEKAERKMEKERFKEERREDKAERKAEKERYKAERREEKEDRRERHHGRD